MNDPSGFHSDFQTQSNIWKEDTPPAVPPLSVKKERRQLALVALGISVIFVIALLFQIGALLFIDIFFPRAQYADWFLIVLSTVPLYLAMPFSLLFFLPCKKTTPQKREIDFLTFLGFVCICFAASVIGGILSSVANDLIAQIVGREPVNSLEQLTADTPFWLNFLFLGILSPVLEELVFRKAVIERLLHYGELPAILISGIIFGCIHGNFFQFFYTAIIGFLLGYLFVRTGNILYPMALHILFNMIGGVYTSEMLKRITDITDENGNLMIFGHFSEFAMLASYYGFLLLCLVGAVITVRFLWKKIRFQKAPHPFSAREWRRVLLLNPGVWVFAAIILYSFFLSVQ